MSSEISTIEHSTRLVIGQYSKEKNEIRKISGERSARIRKNTTRILGYFFPGTSLQGASVMEEGWS